MFVLGAIALSSATYGQGGGPIFLDNVVCTGNESNLAQCQHLGIANHNCFHSDDAGVICPGKVEHNTARSLAHLLEVIQSFRPLFTDSNKILVIDHNFF